MVNTKGKDLRDVVTVAQTESIGQYPMKDLSYMCTRTYLGFPRELDPYLSVCHAKLPTQPNTWRLTLTGW